MPQLCLSRCSLKLQAHVKRKFNTIIQLPDMSQLAVLQAELAAAAAAAAN
jgi:hypothetical protein